MKAILVLVLGVPVWAAESFESALREIMVKNTSVRVQRTNVDAARSQLLSKRLFFLPSLSLSANQEKSALVDRNNLSTSRSYLVTASMNLFRSGADWTAMSAASAEREYQESVLTETQLRAEFESAAALLSLVEAHQRSQVLEANLKHLTEFHNIALVRYKKGYLPLQEVEKVSIDVSNFDARLRDSQSDLNSARENVIRIWGQSDLAATWPWKLRLNSNDTNAMLSQPTRIEANPALASADRRYQALNLQSRVHFLRILPTIDFSYSYGKFETALYNEMGWESLISIKIPLFSGLSDHSEYRTRYEAKLAAEYRLEQEKRNALSNQTLAQENFNIARSTAFTREKTLEVAHRLLQKSLERFRAGRASANDLNVDQNRATEAEILTQQGWREAHLALLRLFHAFGKSVIQWDN